MIRRPQSAEGISCPAADSDTQIDASRINLNGMQLRPQEIACGPIDQRNRKRHKTEDPGIDPTIGDPELDLRVRLGLLFGRCLRIATHVRRSGPRT